jgi:hypothetical protein
VYLSLYMHCGMSLYMHCCMYVFESIYACEVLKEKHNTLGDSAFGMRIVTLVPCGWVHVSNSNLCMHVP